MVGKTNRYWIKTPVFIKRIFSQLVWDKKPIQNAVYLTFDDGPIPEVTEWVLDVLKEHQMPATFFCVGENIQKNPTIFERLINEKHSIGNHTYNHNDGWKTDLEVYQESILKTEKVILDRVGKVSKIFRPPYGKITPKQALFVKKQGYEIIMWDVLSADFDVNQSPEQCLNNLKIYTQKGSIVVFHDNIKSFQTLQKVLPEYLLFLKEKGFKAEVIG